MKLFKQFVFIFNSWKATYAMCHLMQYHHIKIMEYSDRLEALEEKLKDDEK